MKKRIYWFFVLIMVVSSIAPATVQAQGTIIPPIFSVAHGYFSTPFQLTLSSPTPDAQIRYTTDFSTPTPTNGALYAGPITINGTTVIRAVAYTPASTPSATVTQSYIFLAQVRTQSNSPGGAWPSFFAPNNSDGGPYPAYYEMAPEIVNHASNTTQLDAALTALPAISLVTDQPNLWDASKGIYVNASQKGGAWERPASLEWIAPPGVADGGFSVNSGVRIHGQSSRRPHRTPKKTFRMYFRGADYGVPELDYKLFADNDAVSKFDRILLRGGGNRSFPYFDRDLRREADYITDEFARRIFLSMGGLAAHGTFAHLYLNGQYWGLYNVTERMDGEFLVAYLGGAEADYDLIQPDEDLAYQPAADPGDLEAWNELHGLLNVATVDDTLYQQVLSRLDVVDLADYMILLHYIANTDWPAHNWYTYRKRSGPDTRFHMIPWDSDTSLNQINENVTLKDSPGSPARLFLRLMTNLDFQQLVADRFYRYLEQSQGLLTPAHCVQQYEELADIVDPAIIGESARWGAYAQKVYPLMTFTALTPTKALPAYFHSLAMPTADSDPGNTVADAQQKTWLQVRTAKVNNYCPQRTGVVINQYVQNGWYQTILKPPTFSQEGGAVAQNYALGIDNTVNNASGTIYYTVDGVDPRQPGGGIAPGASDGADLVNLPISQVATVRARVWDNEVWSPLHEATFYPPQSPTVTLTSPATTTVFTQGVTVTIQAEANDSDGVIQQVEFLVDDRVVCTVVAAPYHCSFIPTPGNHALTVRATDSQGLSTTTAPVTIVVNLPVLTVAMTSPLPDSVWQVNTAILLTAQVSGDSVQRVEFFAGPSDLLCTDETAPYVCTWQPTTAGNYSLRAIAHRTTDAVDSPTVAVTVEEEPIGTSAADLYLPLIRR